MTTRLPTARTRKKIFNQLRQAYADYDLMVASQGYAKYIESLGLPTAGRIFEQINFRGTFKAACLILDAFTAFAEIGFDKSSSRHRRYALRYFWVRLALAVRLAPELVEDMEEGK